MAATILIKRWTGSGPTKTDITSINTRLDAADAHSTGSTSNPITIPPSASNYSFWCATRLSASVTPSVVVNNIKWYTDGANGLGTGVTFVVNTATTYVQATGTTGTGDVLNTSNYSTLAGAASNAFAYTSGSPLSVTGSISNPSTGDFGDFVVSQIVVASTASVYVGSPPTETITWQFDEV